MTWQNPPLRLYHGTDDQSAQSILQNGINLSYCSPLTDFGLGFYTTTFRSQAESWARLRCKLRPGNPKPAVIVFDLDREVLGVPSHLFFTHEDDRRTQFWQFVAHCRQGTKTHLPKSRNFSVVSGPVSLWPQQFTIKDCDQVSFHDANGGTSLDKGLAEALASGTSELVADASAGATQSLARRYGGFVDRRAKAMTRRFFESVDSALEQLGDPEQERSMSRLRAVSSHRLLLHLDPRHAACLLMGVDANSHERVVLLPSSPSQREIARTAASSAGKAGAIGAGKPAQPFD